MPNRNRKSMRETEEEIKHHEKMIVRLNEKIAAEKAELAKRKETAPTETQKAYEAAFHRLDHDGVKALLSENAPMKEYWEKNEPRLVRSIAKQNFGITLHHNDDLKGFWQSVHDKNSYSKTLPDIVDTELKPGTYYVGDLAIVMPEDVLDDIFSKKYHGMDGKYHIHYNGYSGDFAIAKTHTSNVNMRYEDHDGNRYSTTIARLGLVSESLCTEQVRKDLEKEDYMVRSSSPVHFLVRKKERTTTFYIRWTDVADGKAREIKIRTH